MHSTMERSKSMLQLDITDMMVSIYCAVVRVNDIIFLCLIFS